MNSHQRRKDRREFRYEITTEVDAFDDYATYCKMWDWCVRQFGNGRYKRKDSGGGWREKHGHIATCWQFTTEKKAVMFSLRWK